MAPPGLVRDKPCAMKTKFKIKLVKLLLNFSIKVEQNLMNLRPIIAPLLPPSSWQDSSSMALRKEICDPQYRRLMMVPQPARLS